MTQIEVELYSGRPNPRYLLSPVQTAELQRRLTELPATESTDRPRDGLGYRGLRVVGMKGSSEVVVSAGTVEIHQGAGVRRLADPDRRLELWLVETIAAQMQQGEAEFVLKDLGR